MAQTLEAARKLLNSIKQDAVTLDKHINSLLTVAHAMRTTMATTLLNISTFEHSHIDQAATLRKCSAELHETQAKLNDTANQLTLAKPQIDTINTALDQVAHQADRICNEPAIHDPEVGAPYPGIEYVDITYFSDNLGMSLSAVRNAIVAGKLPSHDAISNATARPKFLWLATNAAIAVHRHKIAANAKKGIAALV